MTATSRLSCWLGVLAVAPAMVAMAGVTVAPEAAQGEALGSVQALFAAMANHDVAAARKLLVPGATFVVVKPDGSVLAEHDTDFLDALASSKGEWRERIWAPQVLVRGDLAQVWAPYDFHLDGKLSHCGTDSFSLVHGADGWRIAAISYTVQKDHCTEPLRESAVSR